MFSLHLLEGKKDMEAAQEFTAKKMGLEVLLGKAVLYINLTQFI